ncbi:hypothetical protein [Sanyastnella coralliicola]|uniref:hypothetical protein n=1 Tax=Sanyastnella coralliicola TaxID=3069118 RepID=UPI0027B89BBE|nr:hypothetical protein [Longitalea sp. SCSIO 12813]
MIFPWDVRRKSCPHCQSEAHVIPVLYGSLSRRAEKEVKAGKVHYGGSVVSLDRDQWYCTLHQQAFGSASEALEEQVAAANAD